MKKETIAQLIGNTPLVRIKLPEIPKRVKLYGKLEGFNPGGSVKDRPAYFMIHEALRRGEISKKTKLVEATSGNTGVALAMVAAALRMDITLIMPENSTQERIDTMRGYGARLILTPAARTIEYSRELADEMVAKEDYFMLDQFANPDNSLAHFTTTGPEIWRDTRKKITHFVSSMGTTGTVVGVSQFLKSQNPAIQIIGVDPAPGSSIPGIRKWSEAFVPKIFDPSRLDATRLVNQEGATRMTRRLAEECGIFVGMSGGGATLAAVELAQELKEEALIVCILPDRGDRYLSSGLFSKEK